MQVHSPHNNDLKCPTCFVDFINSENHKLHYKSDFHRYNLKRKMVKLSPITEQQFISKKADPKANDNNNDDNTFKCNECGKKFKSSNTLNEHVRSKKHNPYKTQMREQNTKISKITEPFKKNENLCLFCQCQSTKFEENLKHMQIKHGFFIGQEQFCINKIGLIEYLQQKIEVGFLCLTCENKKAKDFSSGDAVRKHMSDKGHNFMKVDEGYQQYQKFYDFSKQFEELLEQQKDRNIPGISYTKVRVEVKDDNTTNQEIAQPEQIQEEGDWQDQQSEENDDDESQWQSMQEQSQQESEKQSDTQPNTKKIKTYKIMKPTLTSNQQLLLPNGKILGNRKYRFLYQQTYRNQYFLHNNFKALGRSEDNVGNAIISKQKMLQMAKYDRLLYKTNLRKNKGSLRNGIQNNYIQMRYFRTQNSL